MLVTKCTPRKLNLSCNRTLKLVQFTGVDLSRIEEIDLRGNKSKLVDFNSIFGQNKQVNIQKLRLTFEALGADSLFHHMPSLVELEIEQVTDSPIDISSEAFRGLTRLKSLKIEIRSFVILGQQLKSGLLQSFPSLEEFHLKNPRGILVFIFF
jgi:hypothetical protein